MGGRVRQILLLVTFLPWCWLMMMVMHEVGHVLLAWLTGATIDHVVLHPLAISQTVLADNPHPLPVVWAGPLLGSMLPLAGWLCLRSRDPVLGGLARFFAGFCLVANGVYLALGAWTGDGDAGDLLHLGMPSWSLTVVGVAIAAGGLALWHGLGDVFGLRGGHNQITGRTVFVTAILLMMTISLEVLLSSR